MLSRSIIVPLLPTALWPIILIIGGCQGFRLEAPSRNYQVITPLIVPPEPEKMAAQIPPASVHSDPVQPKSPANRSVLQDSALEVAYSQLVKGDFFIDIPSAMRVQIPEIVSAGVTEEVTKALLVELDINEPVSVEDGVRYDPLGVEIQLIDSSGSLAIQNISVGRKAVLNGYPEKWQWAITPLKAGNHELRLESIVSLKDANGNELRSERLTLYTAKVPTYDNIAYTTWRYWDKSWNSMLIVFTILLFGLIGWKSAQIWHKPLSSSALSNVDDESLPTEKDKS